MRLQLAGNWKKVSGSGVLAVLVLALGFPRRSSTNVPVGDTPRSSIQVEISPRGPIVLVTKTAEFQLLPSGYTKGFSALEVGATARAGEEISPDVPGHETLPCLRL